MRNKNVKNVPSAVYEAMFIRCGYGKLKDIREMGERDFNEHLPLVDTMFREIHNKE